jgi:AraC-like DNA-binding protein
MQGIAPTEPRGFWGLFKNGASGEVRIDYPLHVRILEDGEPTPLDMDIHQGMEVNIVLEGQFERHFEDMSFLANPGDVSLSAAWEPHGWRVSAPGTKAVAVIFLAEVIAEERFGDIPWLDMFAAAPTKRPRVVTAEQRETALALGSEIFREAEEQRPGWLVAVRLCLLRLLLALWRDWQPPRPSGQRRRVRASSFARLVPALEAVHADPSRHISQGEAAAACGLGRSRFAMVFRDTMGISFARFCLRARLALAAYKLLSTDLPVESVAEETGFADASHLHRALVRYYGCTPRQFREMHYSQATTDAG